MCQRPKRAYFISTRDGRLCLSLLYSRVNALNGLTSFLRGNTMLKKLIGIRCQRPKRAYFISTVVLVVIFIVGVVGCQRPKRAYFISTLMKKFDVVDLLARCQRPKRAYFISTEIQ